MKRKTRYGVPYQGSKNSIAVEIVNALPSGNRFVDLMAGGCAITHAAMTSGKYKLFYANDKHGFGVELFKKTICGEVDGRFGHFISREEFYELKNSDSYVSLIWSFGNNGRDYLYSREKEELKKRIFLHQIDNADERNEAQNRIDRLSELRNQLCGFSDRLEICFKSYDEYEWKEGDVVYCDPPYRGTRGYFSDRKNSFDNDRFWEWVRTRPYVVYVSEYDAPEDFVPIMELRKEKLANNNGVDGFAIEKLFVHNGKYRQTINIREAR